MTPKQVIKELKKRAKELGREVAREAKTPIEEQARSHIVHVDTGWTRDSLRVSVRGAVITISIKTRYDRKEKDIIPRGVYEAALKEVLS